MPNYGSTIQTNARLRKAPTLVPETIETIERELREFDLFDLWLEPTLKNVQKIGRTLQIRDRTGNWTAETTDAGIIVGTGFTGAVPTINFPGDAASATNETPLHVPGYFMPDSYTVVMVVELLGGASAQPQQFYNAGVAGGSDLEGYLFNNAIAMRHGDLQSQTNAGQFGTTGANYTAAQRACLWWSYDKDLGVAATGKNSAAATAWNTNAIGANASGESRELVIGGKFNPAASAGEQLLNAKVRSIFVGRESWLKPSMSAYKLAFLSKIQARHGADFDFT